MNPQKKIGNNVVVFNSWVFGPKYHLNLFILSVLSEITVYLLWFLCIAPLYPKWITYFGSFFGIQIPTYTILCYLIEPGIIPRDDPLFPLETKELEDLETNNNTNYQEPEQKIYLESDKLDSSSSPSLSSSFDKENDHIEPNSLCQTIPPIFLSKPCRTCHIQRPAKTSHCSTCDDCILELDHHCLFVSNCIGVRNHKFFYLFLVSGLIGGTISNITSLYHVYYVYCIHEPRLINIIYHNYSGCFYLCLVLFLTTIFLFWCNKWSYLRFTLSPLGLICVIMFTLFYFIVDRTKNYPGYYTPLSIVQIILALPFFVTLTGQFFSQTNQISRNLTTKQYVASMKFLFELSHKKNIDAQVKQLEDISMSERIKNIWEFIIKPIPKSLIQIERDIKFNNKSYDNIM